MPQGNTLLAEKTTLLWFAVVSKPVLDALRDPGSRAAQELITRGISSDAIQELSTTVRSEGRLASLETINDMYYDRFCSPPPCLLNHDRIGDVRQLVEDILEVTPPSG